MPRPTPSANAPRLLVTGASGRVGRLLRPFWRDAPVALQWRGTGPLSGGALPGPHWSLMEGPAALLDWCETHGCPDALLVLSGVTPGGGDPGLNIALAEAALEGAKAAGIAKVLLASSSAVYGHARATPWHEDDRATPASPYGAAKLAMEQAAARWRGPGLTVCCLRIGNVAGADALLSQIPSEAPLIIDRFPGGTTPERSYIGPRNLARVLLALADPGLSLPPILNLAAPAPVSMGDLADAAGQRWQPRPAPPEAIARLVLDCRALEALVRFQPADSLPRTLITEWRAAGAQEAS